MLYGLRKQNSLQGLQQPPTSSQALVLMSSLTALWRHIHGDFSGEEWESRKVKSPRFGCHGECHIPPKSDTPTSHPRKLGCELVGEKMLFRFFSKRISRWDNSSSKCPYEGQKRLLTSHEMPGALGAGGRKAQNLQLECTMTDLQPLKLESRSLALGVLVGWCFVKAAFTLI